MDRITAAKEFSARLKSLLDSGQRASPPKAHRRGELAREGLREAVLRDERTIRNWTNGTSLPRQPELALTIDFLFGEQEGHSEERELLATLWRRAKGLDSPFGRWSGDVTQLAANELALLWAVAEATEIADEPWLRRLFGPQAQSVQNQLSEKEIDYRAFGAATDPTSAVRLRQLVIERIADEVVSGHSMLLSLAPLLDTREPQEAVRARRQGVVAGIVVRLQELGFTSREILPRLHELLAEARTTNDESFLAGNVVNLLSQVQGDLAETDLTQLFIRHAHLTEIFMHNADISGSRLIDCVLADTFGSIWQVGFRDDDRAVLASSVTGQVRAFGVETSATAQIYGLRADQHHKSWSFGFAQGYERVASAGGDGQILVWDDRGNLESRFLGHRSRVRAVAILPDRSIISCSEDCSVYRWRRTFAGGQKTELYRHRDRATTLSLDSSDNLVASGAGDGEIIFHVLDSGETTRVDAHLGEIRCVRFCQDGTRAVSIGDDNVVKIWDATSYTIVDDFAVPFAAKAICFLGQTTGVLVVGADDGQVSIWRAPYNEPMVSWGAHSNVVRSVASSREGSFIASGGDDQTLQVWRTTERENQVPTLLRSYPGYLSQVRALAFVPSGELASAHDDGQIHMWDVSTGRPSQFRPIKAHKGRIWSLGLLRNGEFLVSAGEDGEIHVWESPDTGPRQTWLGHEYRVFAVACRDCPSVLVASGGSDKTIRFWRLGQETAIQTLETDIGHSRRVRDVAFSPDGEMLVSAGEDGKVLIWTETDGKWSRSKSILEERPVTSARFMPDSSAIVYVTDAGELVVWMLAEDGRQRLQLGERPLLTVSISPDGRQAVAGSDDGLVHPVDLDKFVATTPIQAHLDWVEQVLFSSDGSVFATASDDQNIHVYDAANHERVLPPMKALRPYEGLRIDQISGVGEADHAKLLALGAITHSETFS